ncbi:hypothetical protein N7507_009059 [Penicillium longicatenatum]|nr:hypothetical protein N7507_009059 [Penicillium longicatenatum]
MSEFKVIIIGGSISGLTLAHCLEKLGGIDYVVLEKNDCIDPPIGAVLGMMPNGNRILAQLGLWKRVESLTNSIEVTHNVFPDGYVYSDPFPRKLHKRFGFPVASFARQQLIQVLYESLPDRSKVLTSQKAVKIEPSDGDITVWTEDGTKYPGDLVVGADGVHSIARSEIWRMAESDHEGSISQAEKNSLSAEYGCLWGISTPISGFEPKDNIIRNYDNLTILVFPNRDGSLGWSVPHKLDKKYVYPDVPRYTQEAVVAKAKTISHLPIWGHVNFGELFAGSSPCRGTALEENCLTTWTYGRVVCIGDSISKFTPNIGQGANTAIESAAAVANALHELRSTRGLKQAADAEISQKLQLWTKKQQERLKWVHWSSRWVTRMQARDGYFNKLIGRYLYAHSGDLTYYMSSVLCGNGLALDYLPLPSEASDGWKLFEISTETQRTWALATIITIALTIMSFAHAW